MAGTTPPSIPLTTLPPTTPTAASASALSSTTNATNNAVQTTQPSLPAQKTAKWYKDLWRLFSGIEIWVLYITIISLVLALLGLPYMLESTNDSHVSLALAKWTATKDYREYCSAQNETTASTLSAACLKALTTPLLPPPLRKRFLELEVSRLTTPGISLTTLRAFSEATAYFGLFIVLASCTTRLVIQLPGLKLRQWRSRRYLLEPPISSLGYEIPTQVPLLIPRLNPYSSSIPSRQIIVTHLRRRTKSQRAPQYLPGTDQEWEAAGHSMDFEDSASDVEDVSDTTSALKPESDSDQSDTETVDTIETIENVHDQAPELDTIHAVPEDEQSEGKADPEEIPLQQHQTEHQSDLQKDVPGTEVGPTSQTTRVNDKETLKKRLRGFGFGYKKAEAKKQQEGKPAHAYQFGNTIIVEDEDGEVIKTYTLPETEAKSESKSGIRANLERMGIRLGARPPNQGRVLTPTGGSSGELESIERAKSAPASHPQASQGLEDDQLNKSNNVETRFTIASGKRLSKEDFISSIQQLDPTNKIEALVGSDESQENIQSSMRSTGKDSPVKRRRERVHKDVRSDIAAKRDRRLAVMAMSVDARDSSDDDSSTNEVLVEPGRAQPVPPTLPRGSIKPPPRSSPPAIAASWSLRKPMRDLRNMFVAKDKRDLSDTLSNNELTEGGPSWMNKLPRIQTRLPSSSTFDPDDDQMTNSTVSNSPDLGPTEYESRVTLRQETASR